MKRSPVNDVQDDNDDERFGNDDRWNTRGRVRKEDSRTGILWQCTNNRHTGRALQRKRRERSRNMESNNSRDSTKHTRDSGNYHPPNSFSTFADPLPKTCPTNISKDTWSTGTIPAMTTTTMTWDWLSTLPPMTWGREQGGWDVRWEVGQPIDMKSVSSWPGSAADFFSSFSTSSNLPIELPRAVCLSLKLEQTLKLCQSFHLCCRRWWGKCNPRFVGRLGRGRVWRKCWNLTFLIKYSWWRPPREFPRRPVRKPIKVPVNVSQDDNDDERWWCYVNDDRCNIRKADSGTGILWQCTNNRHTGRAPQWKCREQQQSHNMGIGLQTNVFFFIL